MEDTVVKLITNLGMMATIIIFLMWGCTKVFPWIGKRIDMMLAEHINLVKTLIKVLISNSKSLQNISDWIDEQRGENNETLLDEDREVVNDLNDIDIN